MSEPMTAVLLRAAELTAAGKSQQAIDLLRPVLVTYPHHAEAWCRLAAAHLDAGEAQAALDAATRALELDVEPAWPNRLKAMALSDLDRHDEAISAARDSVRRKPSDWRCQVVLAEVLSVAPGMAEDAVDVAQHAARLAPSEARAFQVLGDAAMRVKDWGLAEHAYRACLKLDPADSDTEANLRTVQRKRAGSPKQKPEKPLNTGKAWRALSRISVIQVAGGLLLLLAGMPKPTGYLAWLSGALVIACLTQTLRLRPFKSLVQVPKLAAMVSLLGVSVLLNAGWTVGLALGATTMQPLVISWLCAVVAGALVFATGGKR
ncbi:tetratricopeptide repeat protein [Lentzea sp. NBRC 105346]|uniref:tetratricopeptide repeat protein n=1 Tax=Lentzea sp. NBRC 105346 TaxID=3032205 RepID=UPI00255385BD|nr:tetratricopeptide repeat protein [Lentzea sp. NBRC 105346]